MILKASIIHKVASCKRSINEFLQNTLDHIFRGGMFSLIMITLGWIAIFFYIIFYYAYVPAPSYIRPIHLQVQPSERNKESKKCEFPSAHVRLTRRQQLLMMGQQYKFYVNLEMPESPVNKQLGMFMVCLKLTDQTGFLTSQSCRSNMLHYYSDFLYKIKVIFFSPLFIFGSKEEKQNLVFELYSDYEDDQNHPVTDAYIDVQACNIEIYSATLQINAHLSGLRYFMYWWPITSTILGIAFNMCVVFFTISLSIYNKFFVDTVPIRMVKNIAQKYEETKKRILSCRSKLLTERILKVTTDDNVIVSGEEFKDINKKIKSKSHNIDHQER